MHYRGLIRYLSVPVVLLPLLAYAQPAPMQWSGQYNFDWDGVPIGQLKMEAKEDANSYHMHVVINSKGLVTTFAKHSSDTVVDGKRVDGKYDATLYETHYQTRNKAKHIRIDSDGAGHIVKELCEPPEGAGRPKILPANKAAASDLLTTVFVIRSDIRKAVEKSARTFDVNMYDGRRLAKLHFQMIGKERRTIGGTPRLVIHVLAERTPLEGFTPKELERMKGDPPMNIYFSDDATMMPLLMEVNWFGVIRGQLSGQ